MNEAGIARVYAYRAPYSDVVEWFKRQSDLGVRASDKPSGLQNPNLTESKANCQEIEVLKEQLARERVLSAKLSSQVAYLAEVVRQLEDVLAGMENVTPLRRT